MLFIIFKEQSPYGRSSKIVY